MLGFELLTHISHPFIMRSKLFVPGSRPELFEKAAASACDAISFDLEDAVSAEKKPEARAAIAMFLRSGDAAGKLTVVRVNAVSTGLFREDIAAMAGGPVDVVNLPKVEGSEEVLAALNVLPADAKVLATIETPRGLRLAHEIAAAHHRVVGLQLGYADLFRITGMDREDRAAVAAVRIAVRFAAAEAGIPAYDGAFLNVQDPAGFRAEAESARAHGFAGKSCIHPSQVAIANEVFTPGAEEVGRARRILAAAAESGSAGAFLLDGKMVDLPVIAHAKAVVELTERLASRGATDER